MADDQAVTKVTVTPTSVTIEAPGGQWVAMLGAALDALAAAALVDTRPGPAVGFTAQLDQQPRGVGHARLGRAFSPVRAEDDGGFRVREETNDVGAG